MKCFSILLSCLIAPCLFANGPDFSYSKDGLTQTIHFDFPPTQHEWKLFLDSETFQEAIQSEEEELEGEDIWFDETDDSQTTVRCFTHREGDALEMFGIGFLRNVSETDEEEEEDKEASLEMLSYFNELFPHYKMVITHEEKTDTEGFGEWELTDGQTAIMHGYGRSMKMGTSAFFLSYCTTASKTEYNASVWTQALRAATVSEIVDPITE